MKRWWTTCIMFSLVSFILCWYRSLWLASVQSLLILTRVFTDTKFCNILYLFSRNDISQGRTTHKIIWWVSFIETKTSNYTNIFIDDIGRSWIKVQYFDVMWFQMIDILMLNFYNFSKTRTSLTLHVNSIVYNGRAIDCRKVCYPPECYTTQYIISWFI